MREKARSKGGNVSGSAIVYLLATMSALAGLVALGADLAHVRLAKDQLQCAADAAARAGATGLYTSTAAAQSQAISVAAANSCDGTAVVLQNSDVVIGTWSSTAKTFSAGGASPNAVQVTAHRSAARGTAVKLFFAPLIGMSSSDLQTVAIAKVVPTGYGVVGLNYIKMSGNSSDSYWSPGGYTSGGTHGAIASNGDITLSGSSSIHGDARPGPGHSVSGGSVTGSTAPLSAAITYPNANAGSYVWSNNDEQMSSWLSAGRDFTLNSSQSATLPGGVYYVHDFNMSGSSSLTFTGPATIYCYGNFNMSGSTNTDQNLPANLTIDMCPDDEGAPPGSVSLSGSSAFYGDIYAPQSNVTLSGSGDIYGSVLGLSVTMSGTSNIHYDLALTAKNGISMAQ